MPTTGARGRNPLKLLVGHLRMALAAFDELTGSRTGNWSEDRSVCATIGGAIVIGESGGSPAQGVEFERRFQAHWWDRSQRSHTRRNAQRQCRRSRKLSLSSVAACALLMARPRYRTQARGRRGLSKFARTPWRGRPQSRPGIVRPIFPVDSSVRQMHWNRGESPSRQADTDPQIMIVGPDRSQRPGLCYRPAPKKCCWLVNGVIHAHQRAPQPHGRAVPHQTGCPDSSIPLQCP